MKRFENPKDSSIFQQEKPSLEDSIKFLKAADEDGDPKRIAKIKLYCEANIKKLEGGEFAKIIALLPPNEEELKIELIDKYFAFADREKMKVDDFLSIVSSTSQALPRRILWAEEFFGRGLKNLDGDDFLKVFGNINYPSRHEVAQAYCRENLEKLSVKNLAQISSEILKYVKYEIKKELIESYFEIHQDIPAITAEDLLSFNKEFIDLLQEIEKAENHFAKSLIELKIDDFVNVLNHLFFHESDPSRLAAIAKYCAGNIDKLTFVKFEVEFERLVKLLPNSKALANFLEKIYPDELERAKFLLERLPRKSFEGYPFVAFEVVKNIENLATIRELIASNDKDLMRLALTSSKFVTNFSAQMPSPPEEKSLKPSIRGRGMKILRSVFGDKFNPQDIELSHVALYCVVFANSENAKTLIAATKESDRLNIGESIKGFLSRAGVEGLEDKKLPDLFRVMEDYLLKNPQAPNRQNEKELNRQNEMLSEAASQGSQQPETEEIVLQASRGQEKGPPKGPKPSTGPLNRSKPSSLAAQAVYGKPPPRGS